MGVEIVLLSTLEDVAPKERRGFWTGVFQSIKGTGSFMGPAVASVIVLFLPISELFKISFMLILLMMILVIIFHEKRYSHKIKERDFNFIKDIIYFWESRELKAIGVLGMSIHISEKFLFVFLPIFIISDLGLALFWVGVVAAFRYLFKLPEFLYGILSDKIGSGKLVIWGALIKIIEIIAISLSNSAFFLFIILAFSSIGAGMWNTSAWSFMSKIGEDGKEESRVVGSFISLTALASFASMVATGFLISCLGIRGMFILTGLIGLLGVFYASRVIYKTTQEIS